MQNEYLFFAWCFLLLGAFALVGSIFTWGEGWIWSHLNSATNPLIVADLILTGPLLVLTAFALFLRKPWAVHLGMVSVGILALGSIIVYIELWLSGPPYLLQWVLPPLLGLLLAGSFWLTYQNR